VDVQMDEIGRSGHGKATLQGAPAGPLEAQPAGILTTCWTIPPSMM
jgi:hypothetical protein